MEQRIIKIFPYSYSSLTSFETCPRKHYGERLSKEFERPFNQAASDGDIWHKQAEMYAKTGDSIPTTNPHKAKMEQILDEVRKDREGVFHAELELAVDNERNPVDWWSDKAYTRAKMDIVFIGDTEADSIDWKTGRSDPHTTQLLHSSILLFLHYPELKKVNCRYEWLKEGFATKRTYYREFLDKYWSDFENRVSKYRKSFESNDWHPKQNFLCKSYKKNGNKPYCGVTTCEFYGK